MKLILKLIFHFALWASFFNQYELELLNFIFNKSLFNNLISNPIGVTTKKNIIPITNGEIIFPRKIPNLNQSLLSGFKILEFNNPRTKKITDIINDHCFISPLLING